MEPGGPQIMYGTKRTVTTFDDGNILERLESMQGGKVVGEYIHFKETIKDPSDSEVLSQFIDFMEFMAGDKRRMNPVFEQKTDEGTGKVRLIYKQWSERVK